MRPSSLAFPFVVCDVHGLDGHLCTMGTNSAAHFGSLEAASGEFQMAQFCFRKDQVRAGELFGRVRTSPPI